MYQKLILGLLILVSISGIICKPGGWSFENYVNRRPLQNLENPNLAKARNAEYNYNFPPMIRLIFSGILRIYPAARNLGYSDFYSQSAYLLYKFTLYAAYLLSLVGVLLLSGHVMKLKLNGVVNLGIAFFGSVSIVLVSLVLNHDDIFAAPFFLFALYFLIKKKSVLASVFFTMSLFTSWTVILFAPIFLLTFIKNTNKSGLSIIVSYLSYFVIPGTVLTLFIKFLYFDNSQFIVNTFSSRAFGLYWYINQPLEYLSKIISHKIEVVIASGLIATSVFIAANLFTGYLLRNLIFQNIKLKTILIKLFPYLITGIVVIISYYFTNSLFFPFLLLFLFYYLRLLNTFGKAAGCSPGDLGEVLFYTICLYLLVCPSAEEGNLVWLTLFSLLNYALSSTNYSRLKLILVNLFIFVNLIVYYGSFDNTILTSVYFNSLMYLMAGLYILFLIRNVSGQFTLKSVK